VLLTTALVLLAAGVPFAMMLGRKVPAAGRVLAWPAFIWMGLMFLLLVSLLGADLFGVGLQLSGHTHGGQMWPFGVFVRMSQPFLAGLHRRGDSQIYVSCGTGYWGPPMRLGAPPEITELVLRRA
jgi:hypothetical protein